MGTAAAERRWRPGFALSLRLVLGVHSRGGGDPTFVTDAAGAIWRTARTPDGPGTVRFVTDGDEVAVTAWGAGAAWLVEHAPDWLSARDDLAGFRPQPTVLRDGARRTAGAAARSYRAGHGGSGAVGAGAEGDRG